MPNPPKPSALRALEGNRSRRELKKEPELPGVPECPDTLTGEARNHFNFVAAELTAIGVTKRLDSKALAALSWTWGQFWEAATYCELDPENNAAMKRAIDLQKLWWSGCGRFGLTPSDRVRLSVKDGERPDEDEERFFKVTG